MRCFLVASLYIAAVCMVAADEEDTAKVAAKECMKLYSVSIDDIHEFKTGGAVAEKVPCFFGCLSNKIGGELKVQHVMKKMGDAISEEKKTNFTKCLQAITVTEDCALGTASMACAKDLMAK